MEEVVLESGNVYGNTQRVLGKLQRGKLYVISENST